MFKWKNDFSVNIKSIDDQHKELFKIGNFLYEIVSIKDGVDRYDEILEALHKLRDYAIYHFTFEEKMMEDNGYPKFEQHKRQHDSFISKVKSIDEVEIDEKQKKIGMDLIIFIANWIENHILKTDMEYREFLNDKGVY
ncbi:bacteriohemerythrin [Clostridium sp. Cult1]|jgi:hemerythrin|uniref:bacteriohemerythrin n=1 Tax=Clostridium sp. Cult1 TaxID=2079002 RepID=UPI001F016ECE|nr:bacteriohemerythrin [Clostridium sp. Cult1]MCF6462116.1 bacteriohemerythrin [Clostridium sp. Cult1]